jgi:hypothetical protein
MLFLIISGGVYADGQASVQYDSLESIQARNFDQQAIQNYKTDPDFIYVKYVINNQEYELNWIARLLKKLFGISFNTGTSALWEVVLYLFCGGVVLFVILQLLKADKSWFMQRSSKNLKVKIEEIEQNIHEMDLDELIKEAIAQKNYRRAVRLLYLKSLKELNKKNFIEWSNQKTNSDYLSELKPGPLKKSFKSNTLIFEYIWYGDFSIDEQLLEKVKVSFDNFINEIRGK